MPLSRSSFENYVEITFLRCSSQLKIETNYTNKCQVAEDNIESKGQKSFEYLMIIL